MLSDSRTIVAMHCNNGTSRNRNQNVRNHGKFFTRQLTRDSAAANSSSRAFYYASSGAASVPFRWESRPGTPKHPFSSSSSSSSSSIIPPLTPPPSYQTTPDRPTAAGKRTVPKVIARILSKLCLSSSLRKTPRHMLPASSASCPASSSSSTWTWTSSSSLYLSPLRLSGSYRRKSLSWP
ncbi:hypothetical protein SAY86_007604 [Trapa natans]|uniref:Uncharacterized protein n=1 Tax=Trapa natans TaxID=22666 RepID=A0AAN7R0H4_TRANT|nr:hypothetical protein SAY86_007604 [Trapa natans]